MRGHHKSREWAVLRVSGSSLLELLTVQRPMSESQSEHERSFTASLLARYWHNSRLHHSCSSSAYDCLCCVSAKAIDEISRSVLFVNTWLQKMIHVWACSCFQIRLSLNGHVGYAPLEVIKKGLCVQKKKKKNVILTKNVIQSFFYIFKKMFLNCLIIYGEGDHFKTPCVNLTLIWV